MKSLLFFLLSLAMLGTARAEGPASAKDTASIRAELESIKKDVAEIKESVTFIRRLFETARQKETNSLKVEFKSDSSSTDDFAIGNPAAPITIMEFFDFRCAFCALFRKTTFKQLKRRFIDTGQVRLIYRDFFVEATGFSAEAAAYAGCAKEQGMYEEMAEQLFERADLVSTGKFDELIATIPQINTGKLKQCLGTDKYKLMTIGEGTIPNKEVREDSIEARRIGVTGTPSFLISKSFKPGSTVRGTLIRGSQPLSVFEEAINQLSKEE